MTGYLLVCTDGSEAPSTRALNPKIIPYLAFRINQIGHCLNPLQLGKDVIAVVCCLRSISVRSHEGPPARPSFTLQPVNEPLSPLIKLAPGSGGASNRNHIAIEDAVSFLETSHDGPRDSPSIA